MAPRLVPSTLYAPAMGQVVEMLTFEVDPADQAEFLRVEDNIWTRALEQAPCHQEGATECQADKHNR